MIPRGTLLNAIDQIEGALQGCELVEWEKLHELHEETTPNVVLELRVRVGEFHRLFAALDMLNAIVNDPQFRNGGSS